MKIPHWPLDRIKALSVAPNGIYLQGGRARVFFASLAEARRFARQMIAELSLQDFADSLELTWDTADVYAKIRTHQNETKGWYLKLTIDEKRPEVAIISLHPLEHPIKTNGGIVKP